MRRRPASIKVLPSLSTSIPHATSRGLVPGVDLTDTAEVAGVSALGGRRGADDIFRLATGSPARHRLSCSIG
jgi:hypothetical protein